MSLQVHPVKLLEKEIEKIFGTLENRKEEILD